MCFLCDLLLFLLFVSFTFPCFGILFKTHFLTAEDDTDIRVAACAKKIFLSGCLGQIIDGIDKWYDSTRKTE